MCNAWNHALGCTCGWGTGSGSFGTIFSWVPPITNTYESYINPNAFCPVCGISVFFYQSSNGGRVFFDELGPPWPKHACTDTNSIPKRITPQESTKLFNVKESFQWQRDGWSPFFITLASRIDESALKVFGSMDGNEINIFVISPLNNISSRSIAYIKEINNSIYQVSLVTETGKITTIKAFCLLSEARNYSKNIPLSKKQKYSSHNKDKEAEGLQTRGTYIMHKKKYSKVPKNKAMAIAFTESQKKKDGS